jgi:hypothetical protein
LPVSALNRPLLSLSAGTGYEMTAATAHRLRRPGMHAGDTRDGSGSVRSPRLLSSVTAHESWPGDNYYEGDSENSGKNQQPVAVNGIGAPTTATAIPASVIGPRMHARDGSSEGRASEHDCGGRPAPQNDPPSA